MVAGAMGWKREAREVEQEEEQVQEQVQEQAGVWRFYEPDLRDPSMVACQVTSSMLFKSLAQHRPSTVTGWGV